MANHQNPEDLPIPFSGHDPYSGDFFFGDPKGDELRESFHRAPTKDKVELDEDVKKAVKEEASRQLSLQSGLSMGLRNLVAHIRAAKIQQVTSERFIELFPPVAAFGNRMASRLHALGFVNEAAFVQAKDGIPRAPAGMAVDEETGALEMGGTLLGEEDPKEDEQRQVTGAKFLVSFPNLEMRDYGTRPYFVHRWVDGVRDTMVREGGAWVGAVEDSKRLFANFSDPVAASRFVSFLKLNHHVPENMIDVGESHGG